MRNWKHSWITLLAVILVLSSGTIQASAQSRQILGTTRVAQATSVNEEKKEDSSNSNKQNTKMKGGTIKAGNLQIKYHTGLEGYSRSGNYVQIIFEVTNQGADFEGKFYAIQNGDSSERSRYEENVMIASKETKIITMNVLAGMGSKSVYFQVYDQDAKDFIFQHKIETEVKAVDGISIGVLSDNCSELNYLSKANIQLIPLQVESIPADSRVLKSLDYLVINNFNSSKLSQEQYKEIKEWVNQGGTLVLGTGENASKTLELFQDDFLVGKLGQNASISTSFSVKPTQVEELINYGVNLDSLNQYDGASKNEIILNKDIVEAVQKEKKEEPEKQDEEQSVPRVDKQVITINLEGASTKLLEGEVPLLYQKEYGMGSILLATFDLSLPNEKWGILGNQIVKQLLSSMNNIKAKEIERYVTNNSMNYMKRDVVSSNTNVKLPKTTTYLWIILLYLIVVGPVAYIICKRKKKNQWLWGIVPIIAIIFTGIVYFSGAGTRVRTVSSSYANLIHLSENASCEEVFFSLTTPFNEDYKVQIDDKYKIGNFVDDYSYYDSQDTGKKNNGDYSIGYSKENDKTEIELNDMMAFSTTYYEANRMLKNNGSVKVDIHKGVDQIMGSVENNSVYDYSHGLIIVDDKIYFIGKLSKGKEVSIESNTASYTWDEIFEDKGMTLLSDKLQADSVAQKRISLLGYLYQYYCDGYTYNQGLFIGCLASDYKSEFAKAISVDSEGIGLAVQSFSYDPSDLESSYIYNIKNYAKVTDTQEIKYDFDGGFDAVTEKKDVGCTFSYVFNSKDTINSLTIDQKVYDLGYDVLDSISAYNYETNQFEPILSDKQKKIEGDSLKKYFNVNNTLLLRFQTSKSSLTDEAKLIPIISATKEEK